VALILRRQGQSGTEIANTFTGKLKPERGLAPRCLTD